MLNVIGWHWTSLNLQPTQNLPCVLYCMVKFRLLTYIAYFIECLVGAFSSVGRATDF